MKKQPAPRCVTLEEFDQDLRLAILLAGKPGGIRVVDREGNMRVLMSIPHARLPSCR